MINQEKINVVDDLNKKKSDKKSIAKIIFAIILFGLFIVWFTASFLRNINNTKLDDNIKTELLVEDNISRSREINRSITDFSNNIIYSSHTIYYYFNEYINGNIEGYDEIELIFNYEYDLINDRFVSNSYDLTIYSGDYEDSFTASLVLNNNNLNSQTYDNLQFYLFQSYGNIVQGEIYISSNTSEGVEDYVEPNINDFSLYSFGSYEETYVYKTFSLDYIYDEIYYLKSIYQLGVNDSYDIGYNDGYLFGYDYGFDEGYAEGYVNGEYLGYENGVIAGQKDNINQNAFKTLFNAILNAPYNIFSGLLEFEILGVNLFSLFSFIFTTILILSIIKFFMK